MDYRSLTWAGSGDIDIIMGGNNARFLVQDNQEMNGILKPSKLRFYNSSMFMLPLAFGELTGIWTQEDNNPPDKQVSNFKKQKTPKHQNH